MTQMINTTDQSTAPLTGYVSGGATIPLHPTGGLGNVEWFDFEARTVKHFRDHMKSLMDDYPGPKAQAKWSSVVVIQDISEDHIVYHVLMHSKNNTNGNLANLAAFPAEGAGPEKKLKRWTHELEVGIDQTRKKHTPIITYNSVIINFCNFYLPNVKKSFLGKVFSALSKDTQFQCPMTVFPADLEDFCARFHGKMSRRFVN